MSCTTYAYDWLKVILRGWWGWDVFMRVDRSSVATLGGPGTVYEKPHRFADGSEVMGPRQELNVYPWGGS